MKEIFRGARWVVASSAVALCLVCCANEAQDDHNHHSSAHGHLHHEAHSDEFERGPHRGRLLREGEFALELQIFETGVPPQYRLYIYDKNVQLKGERLSAAVRQAQVELSRLGREKEIFALSPMGDFLTCEQEVTEPHSFDVQVTAEYQGKLYSWSFASHEGRTVIPDKVARHSGINTELVGSREIGVSAQVRGKVAPSEHKIAHIIPRFSGIVREGRKHIGDAVKKGEVLAIIESNHSLQPFEVRSQIDGTVINGHVVVGEFVPEDQWIYLVADFSEVWVDFFLPLRENLSVRVGQKIRVSTVDGVRKGAGEISYVAPYADEQSQSQKFRVVLANEQGKFPPGLFVVGELLLSEHLAKTAVKVSALQKFRDWDVVFRKVGDSYEIAPLELGASDGEWVEVLSGLLPGEEYVSENSFLVKADVLKSGASHDH